MLSLFLLTLATISSAALLTAENKHETNRIEIMTKNLHGAKTSYLTILKELEQTHHDHNDNHIIDDQIHASNMEMISRQRDAVHQIFEPQHHVQAVLLEMREDATTHGWIGTSESHPERLHFHTLALIESQTELHHAHADLKKHKEAAHTVDKHGAMTPFRFQECGKSLAGRIGNWIKAKVRLDYFYFSLFDPSFLLLPDFSIHLPDFSIYLPFHRHLEF